MKRGLVWFRNDLRLEDNATLEAACAACDELILVYVAEERLWSKDQWGLQKTGKFRTKFLWESLRDLRGSLNEYKVDLWIRTGNPAEVLSELMRTYQCSELWATKEHTWEELQVENKLAIKVKCNWVEQLTLVHPEDLPMEIEALLDIFTNFRKQVEKPFQIRKLIELPKKINALTDPDPQWGKGLPGESDYVLDPRSVLDFKGGETAAKQRLQHYFWDTKKLAFYKQTRNGLLGPDYSSKFSPWLANGCISPRTIYYQVRAYEEEHGSNQSTYWLIFELLWRDYFRFVAMKYGRRFFHQGGIKQIQKNWSSDAIKFEKWCLGRTEEPFVNANMKELGKSGWMSNRGRQNVASYLVHDLGLDWRMGAAWFEHCLLDYDPCSNYGNWSYVAGVGNDPRPNRKFNIARQVSMYDPKGKFIQKWNNELLEFKL